MTRRELGSALLVLGVASARPVGAERLSPLDGLNLPADIAADLERSAQAALKEARGLEELPLEDVYPGFVFFARLR